MVRGRGRDVSHRRGSVRRRRVRVEALSLSWRDERGLVHAMVDNLESEYEAPYTLISKCGWTHHHDHSAKIRTEALDEPPTCLECVISPYPAQPDFEPSWGHYAPCCD